MYVVLTEKDDGSDASSLVSFIFVNDPKGGDEDPEMCKKHCLPRICKY